MVGGGKEEGEGITDPTGPKKPKEDADYTCPPLMNRRVTGQQGKTTLQRHGVLGLFVFLLDPCIRPWPMRTRSPHTSYTLLHSGRSCAMLCFTTAMLVPQRKPAAGPRTAGCISPLQLPARVPMP